MSENFQPQPCDNEIFNSGTMIGMIYTYPSPQIEAFVRYAAHLSGEKIDWHFSGGRGVVLVLGDHEACKRAYDAFLKLRLDPFKTDMTDTEITPDMRRRYLNSLV